MKTFAIIIIIWCLIASLSYAGIVELKDGRKVDLRSDGTYKFLNKSEGSLESSVLAVGRLLETHKTEFDRNSIRYMPLFKNNSNKTIIGIKFKVDFKNAFGDSILSEPFSGTTEQTIEPNSKSNARMFYNFLDNPFMSNQVYDKLLPSLIGGTLVDEVSVEKVIYKKEM